MIRTFPRQLKYDLYLGEGTDPATDFLVGNVKISLEESRMAHLHFSVKDPDIHADWVRIGTKVKFYAGYLDNINPLYSPPGNQGFRLMFVGTVFRISVDTTEAGVPVGHIECIDSFYSKGGYAQEVYRYPSRESRRSWADTENILASSIVENICNDLGIDHEISLGQDSDVEYTLVDPIAQRNQTDWAFLKDFANRLGCYCWTVIDNERIKLFFVEQGKAFALSNELEFVYVSRKKGQFFTDTFSEASSVSNEFQRLRPNQVLMSNVSVTEDPGMYGQHIQRITDFNPETGEQEESLVQYDEDADTITYYELDSQKVEDMNRTESGQAELNRILGFGALSIPWEEAKKYYKEVKIPAGKISAFSGHSFLGVTVTATCRGDFRILPYQPYLLHGIIRGGNLQRRSKRFYLKTLEYVFGKEGFKVETEFIA